MPVRSYSNLSHVGLTATTCLNVTLFADFGVFGEVHPFGEVGPEVEVAEEELVGDGERGLFAWTGDGLRRDARERRR